ncbi:hypothetical protein IC229_21945 [Spirosoma sp. BT702]|uniref:Uncharacterized protein n=1 Tax=Spirosoma profusum TaxID=2771354 RepID=A0A926Y3E4_9BACT|nr:hypothetical protein [Spirosoma profusum]MBD2703323.1 hypothetical protein [Spirosoma profusum]
MPSQKDFLKDIIERAPVNSIWQISVDSWPALKEILSDVSLIDDLYIKVIITQSSRGELLALIDKYPFHDWIIHQSIIDPLNVCLMNSFDHMSTLAINHSFPDSESLLLKYKDEDLLFIE